MPKPGLTSIRLADKSFQHTPLNPRQRDLFAALAGMVEIPHGFCKVFYGFAFRLVAPYVFDHVSQAEAESVCQFDAFHAGMGLLVMGWMVDVIAQFRGSVPLF